VAAEAQVSDRLLVSAGLRCIPTNFGIATGDSKNFAPEICV